MLLYHFGKVPSYNFGDFNRITPPNDRFWADPHLLYRDGTYYVFIEELVFSHPKGYISVLTLSPGKTPTTPVKVLERPYHLSYPFIFEWQGNIYMMPESNANRSIDVYRCTDFPYEWRHEKTLMKNVIASDATLFQQGRRWWLFANIEETADALPWNHLHLFWADTPLSDEWTPHQQNPVVAGAGRSRPAGSVLDASEGYVRPSQDCSRGYGCGVRMNRIKTLREEAYEEEEVGHFAPDWAEDLNGFHTFNHINGLTIIDGRRSLPKFW